MSSYEAKARLSACRWAGKDSDDPFFVEALQQAERDPALIRWCTEQRALDDILAQTLREISLPDGWRESPSRGGE